MSDVSVTPKSVADEMLKTAECLFKKIRDCKDMDQAEKTHLECLSFKQMVQFLQFDIK
jgi:hypothetical protein